MLYEHELVAQGRARWHRGRLIPVMRGGDGRDEPLFALPPEDLADLDDEALAALAAGLRERVKEVRDGRRDPEIVGELSLTEVTDQMEKAVLAIEKIDEELASRTEEDEKFESKTDELAARAGVKAETEEPAPEEPAPEEPAPEEPEATVAAAASVPETPPPARRRALPAVRTRHKPVQEESDDGLGLRLTSHAAGLGVPYDAMTRLDRNDLGELLTDVVRRNRVQHGQKAVLAHARFDFPKERMLTAGPDSHETNSVKVRDILGPQALVASGENCAPFPPRYELPGVETAVRPVRAAVESFQAARGGVQIGVTPTMGVYEDAVGVVTNAENEAGGTGAVKNCMRIECPDFNPVAVDSIYQCIEADNLAARAYPELMARIADLVNAEQARLADSKLLTAIKTGSTNVTSGALDAGAAFYLLGAIYQAAAGIRSRNRMPEGSGMNALLPAWVIDLLALDISRGQFDRFHARTEIEAILRRAGITPYFYLDGPSTGTGQIFAAQSGGALIDFPTELQWAIFPPATWLHLDAGELQLGVVRDSSLNSTNDFQIFAETWENIAKVGVESLWVTTTLCPSGTVAAPADVAALCGT